jgi:hypothetical protein
MPGFGTRARGESPAGFPGGSHALGSTKIQLSQLAVWAAVGSLRDQTVARIWATTRELAAAGLMLLADKGSNAASQPALTRAPFRP